MHWSNYAQKCLFTANYSWCVYLRYLMQRKVPVDFYFRKRVRSDITKRQYGALPLYATQNRRIWRLLLSLIFARRMLYYVTTIDENAVPIYTSALSLDSKAIQSNLSECHSVPSRKTLAFHITGLQRVVSTIKYAENAREHGKYSVNLYNRNPIETKSSSISFLFIL